MTRKFVVLMFFLSFFLVCFYVILLGDLPLDVVDDYARLVNVNHVAWEDSLKAVFSFDPSKNLYENDAGRLTNRSGQALILKILYYFFNEHSPLYYYFQFSMAALCMVLIATWCFKRTQSLWLVSFTALFYIFLPSAFLHNLWLSDFAETTHFLILVSFVLFLRIYEKYFLRKGQGDSFKGSLMILFFLIASFLACRIKLSGCIIPIVISLFFITDARKDYKKTKGFVLIMAGLLFIVAFNFPYHGFQNEAPFDWSRIGKMVFMNVGNEFESEKNMALFDIDSIVPVSLLRNLGFFMGWLAIISSVFLLIKRRFVSSGETRLLVLWFAAEILLFSVVRNEPRYLTDAMLPLMILLAILFKDTLRTIHSKVAARAYAAAFLIAFFFICTQNIQHLIFLRNWKVGGLMTSYVPVNTIYNDYYDRSAERKNSFAEMITFFKPATVGVSEPKLTLSDLISYSDVKEIGEKKYHRAESEAILHSHRKTYWVTHDNHFPPADFQLIKREKSVRGSLLINFLSKIKTQKGNDIYVYQLQKA